MMDPLLYKYLGFFKNLFYFTEKITKWIYKGIGNIRLKRLIEKYQLGLLMINNNRALYEKLLCNFYQGDWSASGLSKVNYSFSDLRYSRTLPIARLTSKDLNFRFINLPPEIQSYASHIQAAKRVVEPQKLRIENNPIYYIHSISGNSINFGITEFEHYRFSSGYLFDELVLSIGRKKSILGIDKKILPTRNSLLPNYSSILKFDKRICVGGIVCLFCYTDQDGGLTLVLGSRTTKLSDEPGVMTVVPKGFHQPEVSQESQLDPVESLYREIHEELFQGPDKTHGNMYTKSYASEPAVYEISQHYKPYFLGLTFDLEKGNYHLSYLIVIDDRRWFEDHRQKMKLNFEFQVTGQGQQCSPAIPISDSSRIISLLHERKWSPTAYFTFVEGLRYIDENFQKLMFTLPRLSENS